MGNAMPRLEAGGKAGGPAAAQPARSGGLLRRIGSWAVALAAAAALLLAGGFGWFVWRLPTEEIALDRDADGIVVLTGGASRIFDAMELLAAGRGKRLLISGAANPASTSGEISRLNPRYARIVACCVDFDGSQNTVGNAVETRRWAESHGFQSLIVVTSSYHMPRALVEISHQLPDVALVAFPVIADKVHAEAWWTRGLSARLVFSEYLKYLAVQARIWLNSAPDATAAAAYPPARKTKSIRLSY
jgi:uncharacterized SAM-binding protein YcdF (DUF218 family)